MKQTRLVMILSFSLALATGVFAQGQEVKETIRRTFTFAEGAAQKHLFIDTVNGDITVTGTSANQIEVTVYQTLFGDTKDRLAEARQKIRLEITEEENGVRFYVDAPYRCQDGSNYRGWRHYGYDGSHDFEVKVPRNTDLQLKTINDGNILVRNVRGKFEMENINGGIEVSEIAGAGRIYALNGDVRVEFSDNPRADCYFGSLNGEIDVLFKDQLSADLRIKTFNGNVYTDFDVTYLPPREAQYERKSGKFVYKSDRSFGARVDKGGPELQFDAFNGDIYIAKR